MGKALSKSSGSAVDAASDINWKKIDVDLNSKNWAVDINGKSIDPTKTFNPDLIASSRYMDMSDALTKDEFVSGIKKLEADIHTAQYGPAVTSSSFYKTHQGKILLVGFTVASIAAWFGVLLLQGFTPGEAWAEIWGTFENLIDYLIEKGTEGAENAGKAALNAAWWAFVLIVHNTVGKHFFDDKEGTSNALKSLFAFMIVYKVFKLFGINVVTLPLKGAGSLLKRKKDVII